MKLVIKPTSSQLNVASAVFSNLAAVWLIAVFATFDPFTLTFNIVAAIVSLYLAVKAQDFSKYYD